LRKAATEVPIRNNKSTIGIAITHTP